MKNPLHKKKFANQSELIADNERLVLRKRDLMAKLGRTDASLDADHYTAGPELRNLLLAGDVADLEAQLKTASPQASQSSAPGLDADVFQSIADLEREIASEESAITYLRGNVPARPRRGDDLAAYQSALTAHLASLRDEYKLALARTPSQSTPSASAPASSPTPEKLPADATADERVAFAKTGKAPVRAKKLSLDERVKLAKLASKTK